ncbi:MAG TPA: guanylate kinase [Clostridia bacterium]|nr:guanylate kinase [Clostridia bacterium]
MLVVSGPSGAGKGTLCRRLLEVLPNARFSVSATTRKPRPGEVEGRDYFFVGVDEFKDLIAKDEFLEWASVYGNLYGTLRRHIEDLLGRGFDVVLDIDAQGAMQVKRKCPEAVLIFVVPPSFDELRRRLYERGTEGQVEVMRRLSDAGQQLVYLRCYDYIVVNDKVETAVMETVSIVTAEKRKVARQDPKILMELEGMVSKYGRSEEALK